MKLQNKATGEIGKVYLADNGIEVVIKEAMWSKVYNSLDELNAEWKDYEEPKGYWRIDCDGTISHDRDEFDTPFDNACKSIGNYFETEEEAEKAVEKLKAWKRLKDKGFERVFRLGLSDALCGGKAVAFELLIDDNNSIEDIKLLFGGEE